MGFLTTYYRFFRKKFYKPAIPTFILSLLALFLVGYVYWLPDGRLHIKFYNVGEGDSTFIRTPEGNSLILDGGPSASLIKNISWELPAFDRKIDLILLTHPHADHVTGLIEVLRRYDVKNIVYEPFKDKSSTYLAFVSAVQEEQRQGAKVFFVKKGDKIKIGSLNIEILWPENALCSGSSSDANECSIVAGVRYKDYKALFTSDESVSVLEKIVTDSDYFEADLLKVPHHGSKYGLDTAVLEKILPKLAVISVGRNNYGHPNSVILDLLGHYNIKTLRTDIDGTVEVSTDGSNSWLKK